MRTIILCIWFVSLLAGCHLQRQFNEAYLQSQIAIPLLDPEHNFARLSAQAKYVAESVSIERAYYLQDGGTSQDVEAIMRFLFLEGLTLVLIEPTEKLQKDLSEITLPWSRTTAISIVPIGVSTTRDRITLVNLAYQKEFFSGSYQEFAEKEILLAQQIQAELFLAEIWLMNLEGDPTFTPDWELTEFKDPESTPVLESDAALASFLKEGANIKVTYLTNGSLEEKELILDEAWFIQNPKAHLHCNGLMMRGLIDLRASLDAFLKEYQDSNGSTYFVEKSLGKKGQMLVNFEVQTEPGELSIDLFPFGFGKIITFSQEGVPVQFTEDTLDICGFEPFEKSRMSGFVEGIQEAQMLFKVQTVKKLIWINGHRRHGWVIRVSPDVIVMMGDWGEDPVEAHRFVGFHETIHSIDSVLGISDDPLFEDWFRSLRKSWPKFLSDLAEERVFNDFQHQGWAAGHPLSNAREYLASLVNTLNGEGLPNIPKKRYPILLKSYQQLLKQLKLLVDADTPILQVLEQKIQALKRLKVSPK